MKISSKTSRIVSTFWKAFMMVPACSIGLTSHLALASQAPQDLQKFLETWQGANKSPAASQLVHLEMGEMAAGEELTGLDKMMSEIDLLTKEDHTIYAIHYDRMRGDVRDGILDNIFTDKVKAPRFCKSLVYKPVKITDTNLSEADKKALQDKSDYTACKKVFKDVLGGSLHADPFTHYLKVSYSPTTSEGEMIVWISSFINPNYFLRLQLTL